MSDIEVELPNGWVDRSSELLFWSPEDNVPLIFVPRFVRLLDGKKDSKRVSCLVTGELIKPVTLRRKDEDEDEGHEKIDGKPGDKVGVWASAGLRELLHCNGIPTLIYPTGEMLALKNGNTMREFKVHTKTAERVLLTLESDFRKDSKRIRTPWDDAAPVKRESKPATDDDEDIPF